MTPSIHVTAARCQREAIKSSALIFNSLISQALMGAHAIWFPLYFQLPDFVYIYLCQRHTQYLSSLKCVSTLLRDSHEIANLSIGLNVDHC